MLTLAQDCLNSAGGILVFMIIIGVLIPCVIGVTHIIESSTESSDEWNVNDSSSLVETLVVIIVLVPSIGLPLAIKIIRDSRTF